MAHKTLMADEYYQYMLGAAMRLPADGFYTRGFHARGLLPLACRWCDAENRIRRGAIVYCPNCDRP